MKMICKGPFGALTMSEEEQAKPTKKESVDVNSLTPAESEGVVAEIPNVCKTPSPAGPIPIPYPNIARSSDTSKGSKQVKIDGQPVSMKDAQFSMAEGDEPRTHSNGSKTVMVEKTKKTYLKWLVIAIVFVVIIVVLWLLTTNSIVPEPYEPLQ